MQRPVGRIGTNVGEERFLRLDVLGDELVSLLKKHIGAKALRLNDLLVVKVAAVEIGVVPDVGRLPHATSAVTIHFVEATILRAIGVVVSHMPLAEHARLVTVVL